MKIQSKHGMSAAAGLMTALICLAAIPGSGQEFAYKNLKDIQAEVVEPPDATGVAVNENPAAALTGDMALVEQLAATIRQRKTTLEQKIYGFYQLADIFKKTDQESVQGRIVDILLKEWGVNQSIEDYIVPYTIHIAGNLYPSSRTKAIKRQILGYLTRLTSRAYTIKTAACTAIIGIADQ